MTSEYIKCELGKNPRFNQYKTRVKELIDAAGGCDAFLETTNGELMKLFNDSHPQKDGATKAYGIGKGTFEAIDAAKTIIRGNSDAQKLDEQIAEERAAKKAAETAELKDQMQRGFDSEPLEVELLQEIVMSDLLKTMKTITIGQLKFLMGMKRGGAK